MNYFFAINLHLRKKKTQDATVASVAEVLTAYCDLDVTFEAMRKLWLVDGGCWWLLLLMLDRWKDFI